MKLQRNFYQTKKQVQNIVTEIVSTQHCIKINEDWIELVYLFNESTLQVHVNAELIYSRKFDPSRIVLSYLNVIDVTVTIYQQYKKSKTQPPEELEQEYNEIRIKH